MKLCSFAFFFPLLPLFPLPAPSLSIICPLLSRLLYLLALHLSRLPLMECPCIIRSAPEIMSEHNPLQSPLQSERVFLQIPSESDTIRTRQYFLFVFGIYCFYCLLPVLLFIVGFAVFTEY